MRLLQWRNLLLCSAFLGSSWAKKDAPGVEQSTFDFIPIGVNYFEDSDTLMFIDPHKANAYRSEDAGATWTQVEGVPDGQLFELILHPYDNKRAYIITRERTHYLTTNRGKTWQKFTVEANANIWQSALTFHATDPKRIIFNAIECQGIFCEEVTYYTTNGFAKTTNFLRADTVGCHWAISSPIFDTGDQKANENRILCVARGKFSPWSKDYRLLISDNFFVKKEGSIAEFEPELEPGLSVKGVVNIAPVTRYLVAATSSEGSDEMALYVSDDTFKWHRAVFPHDHTLRELAYTVLESTNYSIQIDVLSGGTPSQPMGVCLTSNSNGTYFTRNIEYTNRAPEDGRVDFEKVSGIQGIVMVNVVDNHQDVNKGKAKKSGKNIKSKISFDDGRTFHQMTCDDKELHLHSVTQMTNSGRVFSSPAPGIVMGIGNTGEYLSSYEEGNLYVSDDAGVTWILGLEGPHKYEFGDSGSILLAVSDKEPTNEMSYSLNHGKKWDTFQLEEKVKPAQLVTTQDSTSLKFLLEAVGVDDKKGTGYMIAIDFDDMHEAQCTKDDMELWHARVDDKGESTCLMGHKQSYTRRKKDADCFIKSEFKEPVVETEDCDCTDADFECDFNFKREGDKCVQAGPLVLPEGACTAGGEDDSFKGSGGWRLIPGNTCKRVDGPQKDAKSDRKCTDTANPNKPSSGDVGKTEFLFDGPEFPRVVYLERTDSSTATDETVIAHAENGIFISRDHGKTWDEILKGEGVVQVVPHTYFKDVVYFLTKTTKVFYSINRGDNIRSFEAHYPRNTAKPYIPTMNFHWKHKDWILWIGGKDCEGKSSSKCHEVATISEDRGDSWKVMLRYVKKCEFIKEERNIYTTPKDELGKIDKKLDNLIYCEARSEESNDPTNNPYQLVSSENFFQDTKIRFPDIVDFATMSEFIVVATKDEDEMRVNASIDGRTFAPAQFPPSFKIPHQTGYTVLDSSTHSVFLHVTVDGHEEHEYGTIIKSNSNGTSYTMSLSAVDRDSIGFVDFEKTFGLEGVALVNVVANYDSQNFEQEGKKLKTMITHNDGAEWDFLTPPEVDADKKPFDCKSKAIDKCSLNIHGYTEREEKSHTYSSTSAIGLMLATGGVGEFLTQEADTFMTSDGGISWMSVRKGKYMWEYGDQGALVVIVKEGSATNMVHYTRDEGLTWEDFKFSAEEITIKDITTTPSDNSRNFILWGQKGDKIISINLDFTGLTNKECKLDLDNPEADDYYLWTPKHPKQDDDCLFGHVAQYPRKRVESKCYNPRKIPGLQNIAKNCSCTRRDFECDFNYERLMDGSCGLVPGFSPPDHSRICIVEPERLEYEAPTGYRKLPMSTCQGGIAFDGSKSKPCPGKGDEFNKKHGTSGAGIFFAIMIPFAIAGGVGYWVWRNWASKFGQIRLGEQSSFDGDAPYIKYPVLAVAGVVAVAQALPLLVSSLWRSANNAMGRNRATRFTTRDSFARGRGDYAVVDEDEGELLGDESDEEV
ncbi:hypothetical protein BJ875DRAFT_451561 [Amylocarpus encephaloides]|uniref:Vacuolar protein sorting/targeting protein 10 n=1 Tax=Amylocarpus encephaloides TaxID=45428 RepID=A0A9P7YQU5_9HELO|nr:hypothetical protein BJ875DRAFT_451561 [Amylocarpus encephaloides]